MPGKLRIAATKNGKVVVREENFGIDQSTVFYPGLSSCISITTDSSHGLMGVHITVATEDSIVSDMLDKLSGGVGSAYVVGQIQEYKLKTKVKELNTRKKISGKIKAALSGIQKVYFYDIGPLSNDADLVVAKKGPGLDFGWAPQRKVYWEDRTDMAGFTPINLMSFESR